MYARVTRDQFEIRDGVFIHMPTQAEFTPNSNHEDSLLVYTGRIGCCLEGGGRFEYGEVLCMMRELRREMALPRELINA